MDCNLHFTVVQGDSYFFAHEVKTGERLSLSFISYRQYCFGEAWR